MVPTVALPPAMPFTAQVTVFVSVLLTCALNLKVLKPRMVFVLGETTTLTGLTAAIVFALETVEPAPGFITVTWICVPAAEFDVPFTVICVADCEVIVRAVLSSNATTAVGRKLLPVIVSTNGVAVFRAARLRAVIDGTGLLLVAVAFARVANEMSATAVATDLGFNDKEKFLR